MSYFTAKVRYYDEPNILDVTVSYIHISGSMYNILLGGRD